MYTNQQWTITGHDERHVPNLFSAAKAQNRKLAVLLPGFAYPLSGPLFYYAAQLCSAREYDVLGVDYRYNEDASFLSGDEAAQDRWFSADVQGVHDAVRRHDAYERVVFIGKSLGTTAMTEIAAKELPWSSSSWIWLTPANAWHAMSEKIQALRLPSLIVCGDADPAYSPEVVASLEELANVRIVVVKGGDHGLDIAGDVAESVRTLSITVAAIEEFIE